MLDSARKGCNWCKLVSYIILEGKYEAPCKSANIEMSISKGEVREGASPEGANAYYMQIVNTGPQGQLSGSNVYLSAFTWPNDRASEIVTARDLQTSVSSEYAFSEARGWLSDCASHDTCSQFDEDVSLTKLPTRVIEVAPPISNRPRLLLSEARKGKYAARSYCWGKQQQGILTRETLGSYMTQLDLEVLSQTIKDAILCTKKLGIDYLWCDALCILQDDDLDKARELSDMKSTYANAYLTIVAASAVDATEGFLQDRPRPHVSFTVPFPCSAGVFGTVSLRKTDRNDFGLDHYDAYPEPTSRRAWTLQEQLLSHRLLIFASITLQYQCENSVRNLGDSFYPGGSRLRLSTSQSAGAEAETNHIWEKIVREYSQRNLTKASDKLVALAGIAAYFAPDFQCEYYAGLWKSSLFEQLHWNVQGPKNERPTYRAPTWSWASVDGPVDLTNSGNKAKPYRCTIINCQTTSKIPSLPFGEVTKCCLKLKAVIRRGYYSKFLVTLDAWHHSATQEPVAKNDVESSKTGDRPNFPADKPIFVILDTSDEDVAGEVYCLAMSKGASKYKVQNPNFPIREDSGRSRTEQEKEPGIGGLVLTLSTDGYYRRIGRFLIAKLSYFENLPQQEVVIV